jgi:hypothetical protein
MPRESRESLAERARLLEKQNHLLSAGFQAAANGEIKWYARTRFDNTSFRFGVFGLTRADGGNLVVQTRVKQNDGKFDRPYSIVIPIDEIQERIKSGVTFGTEYYHLAIRLRNEAVANKQIAKAS